MHLHLGVTRALAPVARTAPHLILSRRVSILDEASAASLLLGTALGGGFLALPHATAPAGCLPSAAVLCGCWLFLLIQSLLVADLVIDHHEYHNGTAPTASFDTLGREAFGESGGQAVSTAFLVLMITTLVAQVAKGSELTAGSLLGAPPLARCFLIAGSLAAFARGAPARLLGLANGALTLGFVGSAACLFQGSTHIASWDRLARADWGASWQALPTLLQLHVYCEVVPTVVELLEFSRRRVRSALVLGSLALLAMQLSWSTLGIAVSDFVGGTAAGGLRVDPVDALLSGGGALSAATTATAACAIATTILGTARALGTWCSDAFQPSGGGGLEEGVTSTSNGSSSTADKSGRWALIAFSSCIAIPALIAARASAAAAYFGAIDLAGAYPVALLWGLGPPLMTMRTRARYSVQEGGTAPGTAVSEPSPWWSGGWLLRCLVGLSLAFLASNLATDLSALLGPGGGARWQ